MLHCVSSSKHFKQFIVMCIYEILKPVYKVLLFCVIVESGCSVFLKTDRNTHLFNLYLLPEILIFLITVKTYMLTYTLPDTLRFAFYLMWQRDVDLW